MSGRKIHIPKQLYILKNRYVYTSILFFVWILAIDDTSLLRQAQRNEELSNLQQQKATYLAENSTLKTNIKKVDEDINFLEQFARETYRMKKVDEDIFIYDDGQE